MPGHVKRARAREGSRGVALRSSGRRSPGLQASAWLRRPSVHLLRASSGTNQTPASQSLRRPLGEPPNGALQLNHLVAAAVCFLAVPVLRETDEVLDVASEALQDVILEGSAQVRSALNIVGMGVQIVAVWFVSTMMMNLWQRCRNGNTAEYGARLTELTDGGSVWVVKSKRGAFHQVNLKKGHASCACRQYVEEGVCPHIKAAKEQLKRLALPSEPAEPPNVERPSVASARGKAALGQPAGLLESSWGGRFSGLVAKARGLQRDARPSRGWFRLFADQRGERAILTSPGGSRGSAGAAALGGQQSFHSGAASGAIPSDSC